MFLLPFVHHMGAVRRAHLALPLTVRTSFRTGSERFVVFHVMYAPCRFLLLRKNRAGESSKGAACHAHPTKITAVHDSPPRWNKETSRGKVCNCRSDLDRIGQK